MDFVRSHFGKMNLWPVGTLLEHICHHFWVCLLLLSVCLLLHPPKSDDKYAQKCVQLVRGSSFRSDFLQNPYFSLILVILGWLWWFGHGGLTCDPICSSGDFWLPNENLSGSKTYYSGPKWFWGPASAAWPMSTHALTLMSKDLSCPA